MSRRFEETCCICGVPGVFDRGVPFYEGKATLLSMLALHGCIQNACQRCYDHWAAWDTLHEKTPGDPPPFKPPVAPDSTDLSPIAHS